MKKTLFLAVFAGAVLAGCVKNEEVVKSDGSPERITFDAPVVGVPTRATEIYGNFPTNKDFAVYALYHEGSFTSFAEGKMYMTNVTCTHQGSETGDDPNEYWAPTNNYYWPKKETAMLTFAAYAPVKSHTVPEGSPADAKPEVEWGAAGFKFNNFTVNATPDSQIDLLYSEPQYNKQNTTSHVVTDTPYDGVTIPFKHALSSILFTASTSDGNSDNVKSIKITNITVKNIAQKGNFVQTVSETEKNWTIAWNGTDVLKDYEVYNSSTGLTLTGTAKEVKGDVDNAGDGGTMDSGESYGTEKDGEYPANPAKKNDGVRRSDLILIPQLLKGGADGRGEGIADATVEVTYTIVYTDNNTDVTESNTAKFQLVAGKGGTKQYVWEMGKRYIYNIEIGLHKIYFNPQVQNWTNVPSELEII